MRDVSVALSAAPFSELLPGLDQFLESSRSGKGAAVDDATVAVGALVEVEHGAGAEVCEIFAEFFKMFAGQSIVALSHARTAGHNLAILSFSSFIRHDGDLINLILSLKSGGALADDDISG